MHFLEKKISQLVREQRLLVSGEAVVVGVSAGPDSMALLHLLAVQEMSRPLRLTAVYVDHGLRPEESEAEAELVRQAAAGIGACFELVRLDVHGEAVRQRQSLEHMGRDLRYQALARIAAEQGAGWIAVAHTADDQAEEVLIRLLRGAGRGGLAGMKIMREGGVVRPLLTTTKDEVVAYLSARRIPFLEDSSNRDLRFLRNQVRLEILPFLEKYNPAVRATLRRNAAVLQDEEDLLARQTARCWSEVARQGEDTDGLPVVTIDVSSFLALHPALQRRVTERLLVVMGAGPNSRQIEQFLKLAGEGQGNGQLHFSKGLRVKKQKDRLVCSYPKGRGAGRGDLF